MARTALNVFFTASLLCGLAILTCTYLAHAASDVLNLNTTAPSLNGTVDDTQDPTADSTPGWQFPWRKFWIYTGFLCAGTGACGLVSGLVLGTLQGFGGCQSCASCDPEAGSASSSGGHSSSYMGSPSDGMAVCGCLFGLLLFAVGVYLVMPMAAASIGYGSGYMVGAVLSTILVLACPCTEGCHTRRAEWKEAWATRTAAARARAGLPPLAAPAAAPAVELPSAKVTSTDAGCKAGGDSDMHSVDLEATVVVPPQQQPGFELH
ncbi:hypothetical protein C2E21_5552 [Chlorella sorokiniana]|uniref:Uncharacterized protein n=1 Tax=Chlorella sorokiniana TaxID=3076 RepID=A0A2P6TNB3_CHLSO|nr:hypothetical protein C2E21_5552 [Chlorella sorokiniana]|eukprot:PRW50825.1 hypothetical protein C2E21_5552 [Chlorella sorokiniana]